MQSLRQGDSTSKAATALVFCPLQDGDCEDELSQSSVDHTGAEGQLVSEELSEEAASGLLQNNHHSSPIVHQL